MIIKHLWDKVDIPQETVVKFHEIYHTTTCKRVVQYEIQTTACVFYMMI